MELCTPQTFSKYPNQRLVSSTHALLQWKPSLVLTKTSKSRFSSGRLYQTGSFVISTSKESSNFTKVKSTDEVTSAYASDTYAPPKVEEKDDGVVQSDSPVTEESKKEATNSSAPETYEPPKVEEKDDGAVQNEPIIIEDPKEDETTNAYSSPSYEPPKVEDKGVQTEAPSDESSQDFEVELSKFFEKLNIKFDPEDSSSLILFGGTAVVALWLTSAIVGAVDSIPLFPKLLEVVGLGYTIWFTSRYLIFKKNRDELAAKIEEIKQGILGSSDD